jgi:hypothetical protein
MELSGALDPTACGGRGRRIVPIRYHLPAKAGDTRTSSRTAQSRRRVRVMSVIPPCDGPVQQILVAAVLGEGERLFADWRKL